MLNFRKYNRWAAGILAGLLFFSLSGCKPGETQSVSPDAGTSSAEAEQTSSAGAGSVTAAVDIDKSFTDRDLDAGYDAASASRITFSEGGAALSGTGAKADGTVVTISEAGTYILSGSCADGQVVVEAADTDKVQLVLDGFSLTCADNAALYIRSADKVFLTLAGERQNTLADTGTAYAQTDADTTVDGVIFSKADLTINGSGSLTVTAGYKHAIVSKDDLRITGGILTITAAYGGLYGKDCVKICGGSFSLTTGADGIQSSNAEDAARGFVYISGGDFNIQSATDGIQAETVLQIDGGSFSLTTGDGSANASTTAGGGWGNWGGWGQSAQSSSADSSSAKGLKSATEMVLNGGSFVIDSSDDGIHTNGDLTIAGGELTISSGDDGMHADSELVILGGSITITKSYEGLEGLAITIGGGEISVTASDDGLNAAGGNDASAIGGRPGQNTFAADSDAFIKITGGRLTVNAAGDGVDSNGALYMSGGEVYVSGPTDSGNGALDYDGTGEITGGIFIAVGSSGMAMNFTSADGQCSLLYNFSGSLSGAVSLQNAAGETLAAFTPQKSYSSVLISAPGIQTGEIYTLSAGSQSVQITPTSSTFSNGGGVGTMGGGMGGPGGMR